MTAQEARKLQNAVVFFEQAVRDDETKGGGDPDAIPMIEAQLKVATKRLRVTVDSMLVDSFAEGAETALKT